MKSYVLVRSAGIDRAGFGRLRPVYQLGAVVLLAVLTRERSRRHRLVLDEVEGDPVGPNSFAA